MARALVVKVTCGAEEPERCNQGFTVAATALAAGAEVSLWLTGEAAWFGVPGRAEEFALPLATPLADLLASGARRRAGHGLLAVRGPPRDRRGRRAAPACGSPVRRCSPRRSSGRTSRHWSTELPQTRRSGESLDWRAATTLAAMTRAADHPSTAPTAPPDEFPEAPDATTPTTP